MKPLILVGGGGHCKSCIDIVRSGEEYEIIGILDTAERVDQAVAGLRIIGTDDLIPDLAGKGVNFLITIGQIKSPGLRIKVFRKIKSSRGKLPVIVSPGSYLSKTASIGEGTIIMRNAVVNSEASVGEGCIINTGALIEHEAVIGNFCHISTNAVINGQVKVGNMVFAGSNSVIANNLVIPDNTVIAAGACVLKSPDKPGIFIGNPARRSEL
jgi:sugar O-acyltransferase (sialic acid O-acetyltransferase NeuD family)